jgi:hypothetical protein
LAQHPDKFKVTVIERAGFAGGQATSISLDKGKFGTDWMNDGVQGGSPVSIFHYSQFSNLLTEPPKAFKHTLHFFEKYGHAPHEVKLQVAFGKGPDGFWTNVFPSKLVDRFSGDIKKFGKVLKLIKYLMPFIGIIPIRGVLKMFFFDPEFGDKMVYPLIALFLGTGNQTANVSCAILERLFDDPNLKLWDYDPETLLPNLPNMVTFPNLHNFYEDWRKDLVAKGVDIRLETDVTAVLRRDDRGVVLQTRPYKYFDCKLPDRAGEDTGATSQTETFDELVMCVLADDALKILGKTSTWRERFVLSGAKFYDDITITHWDSEYFKKHYETKFDESLCANPKSEAQEDMVAFAKAERRSPNGEPPGFRPMYFTKTYSENPKKIEMSFDITNYQHQFRKDNNTEISPVDFHHHIFQSIFLNRNNSELWTINQIDEAKIIERKWWHQLGHKWQHYIRVVPGMMWINQPGQTSRQALNDYTKTQFAGSWTLVVSHTLSTDILCY